MSTVTIVVCFKFSTNVRNIFQTAKFILHKMKNPQNIHQWGLRPAFVVGVFLSESPGWEFSLSDSQCPSVVHSGLGFALEYLGCGGFPPHQDGSLTRNADAPIRISTERNHFLLHPVMGSNHPDQARICLLSFLWPKHFHLWFPKAYDSPYSHRCQCFATPFNALSKGYFVLGVGIEPTRPLPRSQGFTPACLPGQCAAFDYYATRAHSFHHPSVCDLVRNRLVSYTSVMLTVPHSN